MRTLHPAPRSGFTLVEALIAVTFLAVLFLAVAQTSSRASDAFDEGSAEHTLGTTTHRCLERIADTLAFSDASVLPGIQPPLGASSASFRVPASFEGGAVQWLDVDVRLELEPGELDDGVDNDGDSLVDERRVVYFENEGQPDERRIVLAHGVAELAEGETVNVADDNGNGLTDEAGLSFSAQGNVVTVRLTCQRQDDKGRLLTKTVETAVRLRNTGG